MLSSPLWRPDPARGAHRGVSVTVGACGVPLELLRSLGPGHGIRGVQEASGEDTGHAGDHQRPPKTSDTAADPWTPPETGQHR